MKKERKLTKSSLQKYHLIIDEWFVNGFNGAAAYIKFYPNVKRESTARINFARIKALPEIKSYISIKHEEVAKVVNMTHEGILKELKNWIEADVTEMITMSPQDIKKLPIEVRRFIDVKKKIITTSDGDSDHIEISFMSKERAYEMINKHIGFYEADNKQKQINLDLTGYSYEQLLKLAESDSKSS